MRANVAAQSGCLFGQHRRCPHGTTAPSVEGSAAVFARAGDVHSENQPTECGLAAHQAGYFFEDSEAA